jgi:hypothetical protein
MQLKNAMILAVAILFLSACSVTQKSKTADYDFIKITKQGIIQKPLIADLEVSKDKKSLVRTYETASVETAKELVMGEFMQEYKCDLIVHPLFSSSAVTTNAVTNITITANGYPANYRNIRNFEAKDTLSFFPKNIALLNSDENSNKSAGSILPPQGKKKSKALAVLGAIGLGAVVILAAVSAAAN